MNLSRIPCYIEEDMNIPDYDDFYSLTDYGKRFLIDPMSQIESWLSQTSTLSIIELWERGNENENFRKESMGYFLQKAAEGEPIDPNELVDALSLSCMTVENGSVAADREIYYDFVEYLTEQGINV